MIERKILDFNCRDLKLVELKPDKSEIPIKVYQAAAGRANIHFDEMNEITLDLRAHLIKNEMLTRLFQVVSNSLEPEIRKDDFLIIDRSLSLNRFNTHMMDDQIIACMWESESLVKRYKYDGELGTLVSGNPFHKPIKIEEFHEFDIWGVCTFIIRGSDSLTWDSPIQRLYNGIKQFENIMDNPGLSSDEKFLRLRKVLNNIKP